MARDVVAEKTAVRQVIQTIPDDSDEDTDDRRSPIAAPRSGCCANARTTSCARARNAYRNPSPTTTRSTCSTAPRITCSRWATHTPERLVPESMIATIAECEDGPVRELLWKVCDLFVYSVLEADLPGS